MANIEQNKGGTVDSSSQKASLSEVTQGGETSKKQKQKNAGYFDYRHRKTQALVMPRELRQLQKKSLTTLKHLLADSSLASEEAELIQSQIAKITSLKLLEIPQNDGSMKRYYSMADNAGGVTEKTCLIDEETLKNNLSLLAHAQNSSAVATHKIRMNAILKHPKAGKDTEVQREALGLQIARVLGFSNVTQSIMVSHRTDIERHPCLFVPFEKMDLLTDSIDDPSTLHGRIKHNEQDSIEDFGKYSAYFMLCSDPDFIGKNGQNKGLIQGEANTPKKLYIFDQVFMKDSTFSFDHGLNLISTSWLSRLPKEIARHFMGRNKSVINDSSYEEKAHGVLHLLANKEAIKGIFKDAANQQHSKNFSVNFLFHELREDAKSCLVSFNKRIGSLQKIIPNIKLNNEVVQVSVLDSDQTKLLVKAMLVNKLINKPVLFDKKGAPYKFPFLSYATTKVRTVSFGDGGEVHIDLGRRSGMGLSEAKQKVLKEHGFNISADGKSATISSDELLKLDEHHFFDIQSNALKSDHNYLDLNNISSLARSYRVKDSTRDALLAFVRAHIRVPNVPLLQEQINTLAAKGKDLGFIAHVKQCVLFEEKKDQAKTFVLKNNSASSAVKERSIQSTRQMRAAIHGETKNSESGNSFEAPKLV